MPIIKNIKDLEDFVLSKLEPPVRPVGASNLLEKLRNRARERGAPTRPVRLPESRPARQALAGEPEIPPLPYGKLGERARQRGIPPPKIR